MADNRKLAIFVVAVVAMLGLVAVFSFRYQARFPVPEAVTETSIAAVSPAARRLGDEPLPSSLPRDEGERSDPGWVPALESIATVEELWNELMVDDSSAKLILSRMELCRVLASNYETSQRLKDSRWSGLVVDCERFPHAELLERAMEQPRGFSDPLIRVIGDARSLSEDDPDRGEALLEDILATSREFLVLNYAANAYFNDERLLSDSELPTRAYGAGGFLELRNELSFYVACHFATSGCEWNHPYVLQECARTALCFPGLSAAEIVALRRSPQEMAIIRARVDDVARLRVIP